MPGPESVAPTAGPLLVLVCCGLILFGIFVAQLYYYYLTYAQDSRLLKSFVWFIALLEVAHTVFCIDLLYSYFVTHFGDAEAGLSRAVWSMLASIPPELVIVVMTQGLYISRIWQLSNKSILVTSIPAFLVFSRCCFGLAGFIFLCIFPAWETILHHLPVQITLNCIFAVELATDAVISVLLVFYLYKRRTKFPATNAVVHTMMVYIINSGAITCIFSALLLAMYNSLKMSLAFVGVLQMMSKMYANTMLAMLNARQAILTQNMAKVHAIEIPTRRTGNESTRIRVYTETDTAVTGDTAVNSRDSGVREDASYKESVHKVDTYTVV